MEVSDYININNYEVVGKIFEKFNIDYIKGKT